MHWPLAMNPNGNHERFPKHPDGSRDIVKDWTHIQTWKLMEKLLDTGKVKAIGVCNYSVKFLEELLQHSTIVPAVNQIENHPSLPQQEIVDFCKTKGIHITAYSPLGSTGGPMMEEPTIVKIAKKHSVSPSTVLLSWHIARKSSVLAKSVTPARIKANMEIINLDNEDISAISAYSEKLTREGKLVRYVYPPFGVNFGFPDKQ